MRRRKAFQITTWLTEKTSAISINVSSGLACTCSDWTTQRDFDYHRVGKVVLGLLVTSDGMPIGFEVYHGNTFEGKTIGSIIDKLRGKYRIKRFIFVGDRGLFSRKNLEALRGENKHGEFIVGMKLAVFKDRHDEFYDISRYTWINEDLAVYETTHESDRCIITWSKARAERDRKAREDILNKICKKLAKKKITAKDFVTNTTFQRYIVGLNDNK